MSTLYTKQSTTSAKSPTSQTAYEKQIADRDAARAARISGGTKPTNKIEPQPSSQPGGWINERKPVTTTAPTTTTATPTGSTSFLAAKKAAGTVTAPATPTTPEGGLNRDAGTTLMEDATNAYAEAQEGLIAGAGDLKQQEMDSIQREFAAKEEALRKSEDAFRLANEQRLQAVDASTAAQRQEVNAAYEAQKQAIDLQRQETQRAYDEMIETQQLNNKRKLVRKETALGVLGGNFTTAGVADIEETIMQGESAVMYLGKDQDLKLTGLTNTYNDLVNDYKTDNLKIEQWKTEQVSAAYTDLAKQVNAIYADEMMAWSEKEEAIRSAAIRYNDSVANFTSQAVQARYELAGMVIERSDAIKADIEARADASTAEDGKQRDDARVALRDLMTNLPAETFTSLSPEQKNQLRLLEEKAGYPQGLLEMGIKTFKEEANDQKTLYQNATIENKQRMADLKEKMGDKVSYKENADGTVTALIFDPATNSHMEIDLGQIGAGKPYHVTTNSFGEPTITPQYPGQTGGSGGTGEGSMNVKARGTTIPVYKNPDGSVSVDVPKGAIGGQCGRFVNNYLGGGGFGDALADKTKFINSKTPHPGDVFVSKYGWTGHTGIVQAVSADGKQIYVADSNYGNDEKVQHHWINTSNVYGYMTNKNSVLGGGGGNSGDDMMAGIDTANIFGAPAPKASTPTPKNIQEFVEAYRIAVNEDASKQLLDLFRANPEAAMRALESDKANKAGGGSDPWGTNPFL